MQALVSAEELAYRRIKAGIVNGRWPPGVRLVHRKLAAELDVSPISVLPALRMLEKDGLVTNTPGLGAAVRTWSREEIIDLHHIRAFHEALAARLCALRARSADIEDILVAGHAFAEATAANNVEAHIHADMHFHMAIVHGARCPDLQRHVESSAILNCCMRVFWASRGVPRLLSPELAAVHEPMIEAIRRREEDAAESAARQHVEESLTRNLAMLDELAAAERPRPVGCE